MADSRVELNLDGARICKDDIAASPHFPALELPNQAPNKIKHFAIDIGGSMVKLVYFSKDASSCADEATLGGRLHFQVFETSRIHECIEFIRTNGLHKGSVDPMGGQTPRKVKATGGGAFKFAQLFEEQLGVVFDKEDEIACVISGANYLLHSIRDEAYVHYEGVLNYVTCDEVCVCRTIVGASQHRFPCCACLGLRSVCAYRGRSTRTCWSTSARVSPSSRSRLTHAR